MTLIKKTIIVNILFVFALYTAAAQIRTPAQLYPGLFEAIQMQQVYADGKTFVDLSPNMLPERIMAEYKARRNQPGFSLKKFAQSHFTLPPEHRNDYRTNIRAGIRQHIDTLWSVLRHKADTTKGTSLLPLPYSYIVPGGRFREIYYWDSYFTMLGLAESKRIILIESMVKNFAYLIDTYGHIPNGNRTYYLSRSQPPFFSLMVELLAKYKGKNIFEQYRPQLLKEYNYWMAGSATLKRGSAFAHVVRLNDGTLLNRYWGGSTQPREESYREDVLAARHSQQKPADFYNNIRAAAESGWDFSSRWFADGKNLGTIQTTSLTPVDLNCLLYNLELTLAHCYNLNGKAAEAKKFNNLALKRKKAINKYCWNATHKCYQDYNWRRKKPSAQVTVAMAFPLYFGIASKQQAGQVATLLKTKFLKPGGLATTLVKTGQQWDRPNSWAPLQYIAIEGLRRYNNMQLAATIAQNWMDVNIRTFNSTGKLMEKYNTENTGTKAGGGEYPLQDGFGWTNGVLIKLMNLYKNSYLTE